MPPALQPGRCVTYEESPGKQVYAVIVAMGNTVVLVARGTSNAGHDESKRIRPNPVRPRSKEAGRWINPPITRDTYFYRFDIRRIPRSVVEAGNVHRMCEDSLWNDIRTAAQERARQFFEQASDEEEIE
jgi:hypothetical protein